MSADLRGLVNQLHAQVDKMEAVLDAIADPIAWVNSDHRVQGCNAAFAQLVNRPHGAILDAELDQVLPLMRQGRAAPPADYPTVRVLQGGYTVTEYTFQTDRHSLRLEITANLATLTEADRTIVLTIRDVTVWTQIKQQANAIQASMDGIAILDPNQTYIYLNQAHASIYGYDSVEELIGKSWKALYDNAEIQRFEQEIMPEFSQQGQWRGEAIGLKRDGDHFHQELSLSWIEGGGLTCVVRDISNLKRIEADRKQRENALQLMVEGMASTTGEAFFPSCVRCLAEVLQVRYAMVGEFIDETKTRVRTLAIQGDRYFNENIQYDLRNTPCEGVLQGEIVYYAAGLQTLFPNAVDLAEAGIESYLGIPIRKSSNQIIGHLLVMDVKPMADDPKREMVLKIFAARAGAELERRQTETQLRQQQEMLRLVIDAVPNQIFVKDWEGRYLLANQAAADFYNTSVEEIIGVQDTELHPQPEVAQQFVQENRQVIETGQDLFIPEEKTSTITGQEEWMQWQKRPIRLPGNDTWSVLGVGVRITERKRTEEALRRSELKFRNLFENSYVGIFRTRLEDGLILEVNQRCAEILGYRAAAELVGQTTAAKFWTHPHRRRD